MPRQKRLNVSGSIFHIMVRGIEHRNIFIDDKDRKEFINRFKKKLIKARYQCYAWALMHNHFHLLVRSSELPLSKLMKGLLTGYAGYFNHRHKRVGHLYQNRYKSILCQEDVYLLQLIRYIHLNPYRAKIVNSLDSLEKYPWSGHSSIIGNVKRDFQENEEVLTLFSSKKKLAIQKYLQFVSDGSSLGKRDDFTGGGLRRSAGGWEMVQSLKKAKDFWNSDERILGNGDFVNDILKIADENLSKTAKLRIDGWTIEKIVIKVCALFSVLPENIKKKGRKNNLSLAKGVISYLAYRDMEMSRKDIAAFFNLSGAAIGKLIESGEKTVKEKNITL